MKVYISEIHQDLGAHSKSPATARLYCNDITELHDFAHKVGIPNACFDSRDGSYIVTGSKILKAIELGAYSKEVGE